jgi:hypothetical protein
MTEITMTHDHDSRARAWRWCARLALAAAAIALLLNFVSYAVTAAHAIGYPYQLDYGEGIVWQQMRLILAGRGYAPIDGFPAIVFHYPPGFHMGAGMLAGLTGIDQLAAGRALSFGSTLVLAGFVAATVAHLAAEDAERTPRLVGGLLGALVVFTFLPVQFFSFLMRVDMLSFALGFAGFYFGLRSVTRPKAIYVAAVLFVAAIYTKQTAIAGPASVFLVLLFLRPRTAWTGIATILAVGLTALATLSWITDGGFLRHIVTYNLNRLDWHNLGAIRKVLQIHSVYLGITLFGILAWSRRLPPRYFREGRWKHLHEQLVSSPGFAARLMVLIYLALTTLMLVSAMKSGAYVNYFIEWCCVIATFVGIAQIDTAALACGRPAIAKSRVWSVLVTTAVAVQTLFLLGNADQRFAPGISDRTEPAQLAALVRAAPGPVIGDNMVAILRGGKPVIWEPAIFAELASLGMWNERPFITRIDAREFAFFITLGKPGDWLFDSRYSPEVTKALVTSYPVERRLDGYILYFPAGPLPAYAASLR